jgi:hypothetical protein
MVRLGFIYIGGFLISLTFKEPKLVNERKSKKYLTILKDGFRELVNNRILRILCFDRVFIGILTYFLFWTFQIYFGGVGIPILWFGFITALMNIININRLCIYINKIRYKCNSRYSFIISNCSIWIS